MSEREAIESQCAMLCKIYNSSTKPDWYLIIPSDKNLESLPSEVKQRVGGLSFFKEKDFQPGQSLIGANSDEVLGSIADRGFFITEVKIKTGVSDAGAAIGGGVLGGSIAGPVGALVGVAVGYMLAQQAKAKEKEDAF